MSKWTGSKIEGQKSGGLINGKGSYTFRDGTIYEGNFKNGNFDGEGTIIYPNGNKFVGSFIQGIIVSGNIYFWDGLKYSQRNWKYITESNRHYYGEESNIENAGFDISEKKRN